MMYGEVILLTIMIEYGDEKMIVLITDDEQN